MKGKLIWLVASCLVALSLVLASCAPAPAEKKEAAPTAPKEVTSTAPKEAAPKEAVTAAEEKPEYGGTAVVGLEGDVAGFDQTYLTTYWQISQSISYEELLTGDWTRGPAGTGETDFTITAFAPEGFFRSTGAVAESWQIPDQQTLIFKIRRGIRFHNKPPVNGRELDANDVAFSINYMYLNPKAPNSYNVNSAPGSKKVLSATAIDKWTVVVKVEDLAPNFLDMMGGMLFMVPRESIEKYGNLQDWRNSLGTGAFMLTNYVPGSALSFVKNPDYWMKNPIGPGKGDQLPYLDGVKALIIPDASTREAAIRTGKVDQLQQNAGLLLEGLESQLKTNPQIKYKEVAQNAWSLAVRLTSEDPLAAPLKNKRVRQALFMAIDREAILRDYYKGKAIMRRFFFEPNSPYYGTLDEKVEILQRAFGFKPEEAIMVKKMWEYHPDEAKKILKEEGYPNGFKTVALITPTEVDLASIVKADWAKIGVDLALDVRESVVKASITDAHKTQAMFGYIEFSIIVGPERWIPYGPATQVSNRWEVIDPILDDYRNRSNAVYGDFDARSKVLQEIEPYIIQLGISMLLPAELRYHVWHPWLKNYHGESAVGGIHNVYSWLTFAWYDQELKKKMGY